MLGEILEYVLTPASRLARAQGFLRGSIQIRSRYGRCGKAWAPHLAQTRRVILDAANRCRNRRRVLVLGGGLVHDVPVAELCAVFKEVVLVDLAHPLSSRIQTWRWGNLRRLEWDITGVMDRLADTMAGCEPDLCCGLGDVDLVVSVNVLSQICWAPARILDGIWEAAQLDRFLAGMVRGHLTALKRVPCDSALITDYAWSRCDVRTQEATQWGVLQGVELPGSGLRWDWAIAPAPERERAADFTAQVAGYVDWKQSGWA